MARICLVTRNGKAAVVVLAADDDRLLPVSVEIADLRGPLGVPDPIPTIDGLLAATALAHNLIMVTRNTVHVARTGARLLNPFEERASTK